MANIYSWHISQFNAKIEEDGHQNVIYEIIFSYRLSNGEENPIQVQVDDMCRIEYNPEGDFIPYEDLTKEIVVGWIESIVDVAALKEVVDNLMEQQLNPTDETLTPNWNDPV